MYYVYSTSFIVPLLHRAPYPPTEPCNQWQPQCRPFLCPVAPTKTSVTLSQPGRSPPVVAWEAWAVWWRGQTCLQPKAAVQCPRLDPNRPTASWRKASPRESCSTTSTSAGRCCGSVSEGVVVVEAAIESDGACFSNRKEPVANPGSNGKKDVISGREENNIYTKVYHKDGTEIDLTKNSLPSGGKYEKVSIVAKDQMTRVRILNMFQSSRFELGSWSIVSRKHLFV